MINILPYNEKKMIERARAVRIMTTIVWSMVLLVCIGAVLYFPTLITINSRYAIALGQMAILEQSGAITSPVDVESIDKRTRDLVTKLAQPLPVSPTDYVATARRLAPSDVSLTGFNADENILQINGIAATRNALQAYVAALQKDESIESVDSPVSNFVKSVRTPFTISVTFKVAKP